MSLQSRKLSHVYTVDGLRVLALMAVVFFHMWPNIMPGGFYGVVIFFVLAGFFTSRNFVLEQTDGTYPSLAKYYRKKFIRLYLPLLAMVVFVNFFTHAFVPDIYGNCIDATPSVLLGFNNYYQLASGASYFEMHGNFKPFTHLWALSLEMQFYLIYPILMRTLSFSFKNNVNRITLVLWILSAISAVYMALKFVPGTDPTNVYYSSIARMSAFTIGGAFAFGSILGLEKISLAKVGNGSFNGPQGRIESLESKGFYRMGPTPFQSLAALVLLILMIIPFFVGTYQSAFTFRGGMVLYAIIVSLFIVLIYHDDTFLTPLFASLPMRVIAARSYSYFIWQYPIMMIFAASLAHSTMPVGLSNLLQIVAVVILGEISYRLLERGPKKRPYLATPELTAGIAPVLGIATVIMFVVAVASPVKPTQNDADIVKAKIEEAERAEALRRQHPQQAPQEAPAQGSDENGAPANATETPADPTAIVDREYGYTQQQLDRLKAAKVTIVGDSVVDMTREDLVAHMPLVDIDAKISRQMTQGLEVIKEKVAQNALGDVVVVALGANGNFNHAVLEDVLRAVQGRPLVFVNCVTPDPAEQPVNRKIKEFVDENSAKGVYLVDWYAAAKGHRDYFYRDATHPKPKGARVYDKLIMDEILKVMPESHALS